jgi:hypothetical protein
LKSAKIYEANYFSNAVLINDGNMKFRLQALPWQAQLTPYRDAVSLEGKDAPDILLVGNYYDNNIQMGRYDADYGSILVNKGNAQFSCEGLNGLAIPGQSRHIRRINLAQDKSRLNVIETFVIARNNDSLKVIQFISKKGNITPRAAHRTTGK